MSLQILDIRPLAGAVSAVQWNLTAAFCFVALLGFAVFCLQRRELFAKLFCCAAVVFFLALSYFSSHKFYRMESDGHSVRLVSLLEPQTLKCAEVKTVQVMISHRGSCSLRVSALSGGTGHPTDVRDFLSVESSNRTRCAELSAAAEKLCR